MKHIAAIIAAGFLLLAPSGAAAACVDNPTEPLEAEAKVKLHKPINEVVEAMLHDAENIYMEGAHIVALKPRTDVEGFAIDRMQDNHDFGESFGIKECHFAVTWHTIVDKYEYPEALDRTLVRLQDFDTYIYHAEVEARVFCSNDKAAFHLNLARQSLDHAWMEFKGKTDERKWEPDESKTPEDHAGCIKTFSGSPEEIQDQVQRYRKIMSTR